MRIPGKGLVAKRTSRFHRILDPETQLTNTGANADVRARHKASLIATIRRANSDWTWSMRPVLSRSSRNVNLIFGPGIRLALLSIVSIGLFGAAFKPGADLAYGQFNLDLREQAGQGSEFSLLRADLQGVHLQLTTPPIAVDQTMDEWAKALGPELKDLLTGPLYSERAGQDAPSMESMPVPPIQNNFVQKKSLPTFSVLLAVPADANLRLSTLSKHQNSTGKPLEHYLPGTENNELIQQLDKLPLASIQDEIWFRDLRLVRLQLQPFQSIDQATDRQLVQHRSLDIRIDFERPDIPSISSCAAWAQPSSDLSTENRALHTSTKEQEQCHTRSREADTMQRLVEGHVLNSKNVAEFIKLESKRDINERHFNSTQDRALQDTLPADSMDSVDSQDSDKMRSGETRLSNKTADKHASDTSSKILQSNTLGRRLHLAVVDEGIYSLSGADLTAAGIDLGSIDPERLAMLERDVPIAMHLIGADDMSFDPEDQILFYGRPLSPGAETLDFLGQKIQVKDGDRQYSHENPYWLVLDSDAGRAIASQDSPPAPSQSLEPYYRASIRRGEVHRWWSTHFDDDDPWFWNRFTGPEDSYSGTYTMTLSAIASTGRPANIHFRFASFSGGSRVTKAAMNSETNSIGQHEWQGSGRSEFGTEFESSLLKEGENELIIENVQTQNQFFMFDDFTLEYDREFVPIGEALAFDLENREEARRIAVGPFSDEDVEFWNVSDPAQPIRMEGGQTQTNEEGSLHEFGVPVAATRYVIASDPGLAKLTSIRLVEPSTLRETDRGADHIIIAPRIFMEQAQRLSEYRRNQGMRTTVVDLQEIYDEFGAGQLHPRAIRTFLRYAAANWAKPAPAYAVLVGDGHWNPHAFAEDNLGKTQANLMPPNLAWVDPYQGEVDSSNLLASLVGDDVMPDIAIGRIPVKTPEELSDVIDKTINYEELGWADWKNNHIVVADNPDNAGNFTLMAQHSIRDWFPPNSNTKTVLLQEFEDAGLCQPDSGRACPEVGRRITQELDQGAMFLNYLGHGSYNRWAAEQLLVNKDFDQLTVQDRPSIFLSWTCLDGYWFFPNRQSLTETALRHPRTGAVATFSPTGLGVSSGHDIMHRAFYNAVYKQGVDNIGQASLVARMALVNRHSYIDLVNTYTVFGDPALRLYSSDIVAPPTPTIPPDTIITPRLYLPKLENS